MDYTPLIVAKIRELKKNSPDLSFGDILYSILREPMLRVTPKDANIAWLRDVSDFDFFNSITRLQEEEAEYKNEQ